MNGRTADWAAARDQVLARYATVYAFCSAHPELKRSTVYQVLSGRYCGKLDAQVRQILVALGTAPKDMPARPALSVDQAVEELQAIRCSHCRRLDRRACSSCHTQTDQDAREFYMRLFGRYE